jgi:hypothetical protein
VCLLEILPYNLIFSKVTTCVWAQRITSKAGIALQISGQSVDRAFSSGGYLKWVSLKKRVQFTRSEVPHTNTNTHEYIYSSRDSVVGRATVVQTDESEFESRCC